VLTDSEKQIEWLLNRSPSTVDEILDDWLLYRKPLPSDALPEAASMLTTKSGTEYEKAAYQKLLGTSSILSVDHIARIDEVLPITCQLCKWTLLYRYDAFLTEQVIHELADAFFQYRSAWLVVEFPRYDG